MIILQMKYFSYILNTILFQYLDTDNQKLVCGSWTSRNTFERCHTFLVYLLPLGCRRVKQRKNKEDGESELFLRLRVELMKHKHFTGRKDAPLIELCS